MNELFPQEFSHDILPLPWKVRGNIKIKICVKVDGKASQRSIGYKVLLSSGKISRKNHPCNLFPLPLL